MIGISLAGFPFLPALRAVCRTTRTGTAGLILLALSTLCLAMFAASHPAIASPDMMVTVDGTKTRVPLLPRTALPDETASFTPAQAADLLTQPNAERVTRVLSRGYLSDVIWSRMTIDIQPEAAGTWYFVLELPNFDQLDVYRIGSNPGDAPEFLFALGDRVMPVTDIRTRFHIAPIELKPGRLELLVRGETASSMTMDINLRKLDAMLREEGNFVSLQIFLLGMFSVLFFGSLILFCFMRHFIYLIYCANLVAHTMSALLINGVGPGILWPVFAQHFHIGPQVTGALSICTTIMFAAYFLSTTRVPRLVKTLLWSGAALSGVFTLVCILVPVSQIALTHAIVSTLGSPVLSGLLLTTTIAVYRNEPAAWPLMLTWIVFLGVIAMVFLRDWGYLPSNPITLSSAQIAVTFEVLVFAGMLVHRLSKLQSEKIALQQEALAIARAQEEVLERRVEDRTAELAAAVKREREAHMQQRQFVAMVSHEFRTPLAVIDSVVQNLMAEQPGIRSRIQRIREMVKRLLRMIETCLIDERIEDGALRISRKDINLPLLLEATVGTWEQTAPDHDFNLELPENPPCLLGDAHLLEIAINNLLENAIKYTPAGSTVTITVTTTDSTVNIAVLDNGSGIAQHEQNGIFEKYRKGNMSSGTGLGLYLVRAIAEAHEGSITYEENEPRGSCFTIRLPIGSGPDADGEHDNC